ncbi:MAG: 1-deoxy-D-xylulose-5-phosphate reductoisomerase [Bacteroidales bacterium]|jgi:1-deoxy-D-xylulose-5-phosphate reductoisomerase|nr:1-deoxy-D-xylulose-5-phosphate reductoisomerase [Bacteroidales bacterium]
MAEKIAILGSTGSIGSQALNIISGFPEQFAIEALVAGNNVEMLVKQARRFLPEIVVIGNKDHYSRLKTALEDISVKVYAGNEAVEQVVSSKSVDVVIAAIAGYSGLRSTIAAVKAGKKIALANKETLVVAGEIIEKLVSQTGSVIIPVDSEHSAILQCLTGESGNQVEHILLTASGGPFLNCPLNELHAIKPEQALKHPNWNMGNKVTVDSASLMNKGLEVIEAKWLFDIKPEQIKVVIHPQSIIHSFVYFTDGSVKAQLGTPDMRTPILYALTYPERLATNIPRLDLVKHNSLTFFEPDTGRFRNLSLAYAALAEGGNMPCIMNAANEVAVDAFLNAGIRFTQIPDIVEHAMQETEFAVSCDLDSLEITDKNARTNALNYINKLNNK